MKTKRILISILCVVTIICCLTGCSPKTAQTVSGFTEFMEAAGFEVQNVTANTETNGLTTAVLIAACENYQIEFSVLKDSETGEFVFTMAKNLFDEEYSVKTMSLKVEIGDYNYYSFTADGNFHMITRIENTMIWCVADKAYKEEIVDCIKALGYR